MTPGFKTINRYLPGNIAILHRETVIFIFKEWQNTCSSCLVFNGSSISKLAAHRLICPARRILVETEDLPKRGDVVEDDVVEDDVDEETETVLHTQEIVEGLANSEVHTNVV